MVDCPLAISSANCQLLLDCIEDVRDCRTGNLLGLFLDSLLQHWDWSCLPSNFVKTAFLSMVMMHCASFQCGVSKLSCRKWVTQLITTTTSDFSALTSSPSSVGIMAVGVIGYRWTWQLPTTPRIRWLSSSNKALSPSFLPKDAEPPCIALLRPVEDFWPMLKKVFYDGGGDNFNPGTEAENQEGPANFCSDDPLHYSQSTFGSLRLKWLLGGLQLGIELSTNLPCNINKLTYFYLWTIRFILIL